MSFRWSPARFAAFELNYAHARDTQHLTNTGVRSAVHAGVHEVTGAYVLNLPSPTTRTHPFVLVGGGILQFNPITVGTSSSGTQSQNKPAVLWGTGINYEISRHFAVRLQYRGLFYAAPSFKVASLKTDTWQPLSEPSVGIVYRF